MFLFFSFFITSCSKKVAFVPSLVVPAAEGYVKVKRDDNRNYLLEVRIDNLAEPRRLQPPRNVYVVWVDTEENGTQNVGQLKSSSGFFTSSLTGSLTTVTPFKPTRVFITAEERANIQKPEMQTVLITKSF